MRELVWKQKDLSLIFQIKMAIVACTEFSLTEVRKEYFEHT